MMTNQQDVLFQVQYGSKLYGTSTPASDTDLKSIYLPAIDEMLLGKKLTIFKTRVDANGVKVPDKDSMPDNGVENEYFPLQTFVRDFVNGQTYALEIAWAIKYAGPEAFDAVSQREYDIVCEMIDKFANSEVYSMTGFAQKQTLDYVYRGERLNEAQKILDLVEDVLEQTRHSDVEYDAVTVRLDDIMPIGTDVPVLEYLSWAADLKIGSTVNNNRTLRTLELNGRSYTETTTLMHVQQQLQKLVTSYGVRTNAAAKADVDFKSLSHAVRVYQQAIEILDTGKLTFPRANAAELLTIKQGRADLEAVKLQLKALDAEVLAKLETSTVRKKTPELVAQSEQWLLQVLRELYVLN